MAEESWWKDEGRGRVKWESLLMGGCERVEARQRICRRGFSTVKIINQKFDFSIHRKKILLRPSYQLTLQTPSLTKTSSIPLHDP
jgi:hypothetical protein